MANQQGNVEHDSTASIARLAGFLQHIMEAACAEAMQKNLVEEEWLCLGERDFQRWEMTTSFRPNYPELASWVYGARSLTPLTDEIIDLCKSDGLLNRNIMRYADGQEVRGNRRLEQMHVERILTVPLVAAYFERIGGLGYEPGVAQHMASDAVAALVATSAPACRLSPLVNVRLIATEYQVDPGVRIRALTPEDIETWLNRKYSTWSTGDRPAPINQLNGLWCAVEVEYQRPFFDTADADDTAREQAEEVLTALRLAGDGDMYPAFHDMHVRDRIRPFMFVERQASLIFGTEPFIAGPRTMLHFRRILHAMRTSPNAAKTSVALRRWTSATERTRPDDRLLDYWIGLESLLLGRRERSKQITAAVRGSVLVSVNQAEKAAVADQFYDSYDCRSAIMHGDVQGLARYDVAQEAATTRELLKRCLLTILEGQK